MVSTALHTASLFGNGLSGVDLKVTRRGVFVIAVNLNPSIEAGVEDAHLKGELYTHPHRIRAPHRGSAGGLRWGRWGGRDCLEKDRGASLLKRF